MRRISYSCYKFLAVKESSYCLTQPLRPIALCSFEPSGLFESWLHTILKHRFIPQFIVVKWLCYFISLIIYCNPLSSVFKPLFAIWSFYPNDLICMLDRVCLLPSRSLFLPHIFRMYSSSAIFLTVWPTIMGSYMLQYNYVLRRHLRP